MNYILPQLLPQYATIKIQSWTNPLTNMFLGPCSSFSKSITTIMVI